MCIEHAHTYNYIIFQLSKATKDHDVQAIFNVEDNANLLLETGYDKPIHTLKLQDVSNVCAAMTDYHCMLKAKASMDQFMQGLDMCGVAEYVKTHPHLMKPFFHQIQQKMDAGMCCNSCVPSTCYKTDISFVRRNATIYAESVLL